MLDHLKDARHALIMYRDGCFEVGESHLARAAEDVIDQINKFPELYAERREALDEMVRLGQEFDNA